MKKMKRKVWLQVCFSLIVVLGFCSSGYAGVLFSDTFECEAEIDVQDLQNEACDAGRSGNYASSGYLQSPDGWTYQHQVRTTNELLLYDGKATPNVDMSGSDSDGGFSVSVDMNPARTLAPTTGDWAGIVVGGSGLNDVWADGFGVLFRKNGTIQAWDNGAMLVNDTVTWNATPDDVYHNLQIVAADATDGNPFDGVGTTTFEIFIDGSSVYSVDLDGANYPENYVTLQGQVNCFYDNLVISQFSNPDTVSNRYPGSNKTMIPTNVVCSWDPPENYTPEGYDVYVGTDPNNLPATAEYSSLGQTGTTFDPGGPTVDLAYETDYYWQVNALEPNGVGNPPIVHSSAVWKFTTQPFSSVTIETPDMMTWSDEAVALQATVLSDGGSTIGWTAEPNGLTNPDLNIAFSPSAAAEDPVVTITNTTGAMVTVTMTLTADDGVAPVSASVEIDVYPDACAMSKFGEGNGTAATDFDGNCITDLNDFVEMAALWLLDTSSTEPLPR